MKNHEPPNKEFKRVKGTILKQWEHRKKIHRIAIVAQQPGSNPMQKICDKEWHYYVINVEFPIVTLYVDGVTYEPYLVTDDWPIHPSHIDMQLTVGACWQGGEVVKPRFAQYFRGSLAGLTIHPGKIESQKVISCLQACKEGLDINSLESLGKGIKFHFNPAQSLLVMEGDDLENMNQAQQQVSYINSRQFPTPGIRRLKITTRAQCFGEDTCINIPDIDAYIVVMEPNKPKITISGLNHFARQSTEFESTKGVVLFPDVRIISTVTKMEQPINPEEPYKAYKPMISEEILHNLDFCDILVIGEELIAEQESLELDRNELHGKHLDATNSTAGMSVYGVDTITNYEQVIRQIRYRNWHTPSLSGRKFRVTCSELNGRYTSNEFNLEVDVLHNSDYVEHVNHMVIQPQFLQSIHHSIADFTENNLKGVHNPGVPSAATVVIVICVSFLVFLVVLGAYRIHVAYRHANRLSEGTKENEMDWDDSALTITVNPMENYEQPHQNEAESDDEEDEEEEEGEDDGTSADSDESEDEAEKLKQQNNVTRREQLEWDDSAVRY
ncbi:calsyntenin-2-like [Protopterus annectens]|uniref:calsyntenin-2-like n=1 Tax=Protopterus annectens TaxID=7888 RepID=UPI001CFAC558|nr:calsyntenin-2-like [Protopterus annectens]